MDERALLIVDLEATCWENRRTPACEPQSIQNMEIIEFGCALPGPVVLAEPAVLIPLWICLPVLLPEQEQSDVFTHQFLVDLMPVRYASNLGRQVWRGWEQRLLQASLTQIFRQWPAQTGLGQTQKILAHSGAANAAGRRNLSVAQSLLPFQAKDFFDLTHGQPLRRHLIFSG